MYGAESILLHKYLVGHCQMNDNPCTSHEVHTLFEHGFKLENTSNEPRVVCMALEWKDTFVIVVYNYDVVTTLWRSKFYTLSPFCIEKYNVRP